MTPSGRTSTRPLSSLKLLHDTPSEVLCYNEAENDLGVSWPEMLRTMTNRIELLAPAKDLECGLTAINCGADAVYIGAERFGARESAGNRPEDIEKLVHYAHKYWARVYVTLNTLLRDSEIPAAVQMTWQLHEIGVDGLIIQDVGLLECDLPPIPLIASTQMHNATPEKAAFLEQAGFQRVILARELDLDEIRAIRRAAPTIELEFFAHGALCVCYSGQCYLSYALGGRSGNRGQCAQPCRKLYRLEDRNGNTLGSERHYLSLRDLNLSDHLEDLLDAGVASFKIEGRLKDAAYVANVVAYYRKRLDEVMTHKGLRRSSSGSSSIGFVPDPAKTFNRGFTTYFLLGQEDKIGSLDTPKMMGEPVGTVTRVEGDRVTVDTEMKLRSGDGFCFFDSRGVLTGSLVNGVQGNVLSLDKTEGIRPGTTLFRNHDHEFLARLAKSRPERRIQVAVTLRQTHEGLVIGVTDEDGVQADLLSVEAFEPARKPGQAVETARRQLAKMGDSEFVCTDVSVDTAHMPFLPVATWNTLRRTVLERLAAAREEQRPRLSGTVIKNDVPYPETGLTYLGNVLNSCAERFFRRHGVTDIEPAAESGLDMRGHRVMTTRYCLRRELDLCPHAAGSGGQAEPLTLIDEQGNRLELRFNCASCEMDVYLE